MSLFCDFEIGPNGRRFRRAVDGDRYEIEVILKRQQAEVMFGDVDVGCLIELATLPICMLNDKKEVIGFIAFCDHPNVAAVNPADWEVWIRNMFQKYYTARNTLFIHLACFIEEVTDKFVEEAMITAFYNDVYIAQIVVIVPPRCPFESLRKFKPINMKPFHKYFMVQDELEILGGGQFILEAKRSIFCPKLKVRRAVEEDNDDLVELLDGNDYKLRKAYGDFYISEIIGQHANGPRKIIVAEHKERAVGVMCLNTEVNVKMLQNVYDLNVYHGLVKVTPIEKDDKLKRKNNLLKQMGEPIMSGRWCPYHRIKKIDEIIEEDNDNIYDNRSSRKIDFKVNFGAKSAMRRSFDQIYYRQQSSDDYSDKVSQTSDVWISPEESNVIVLPLLEADPFDYDIVNIDSQLLMIPEGLSFDIGAPSTLNLQFEKDEDSVSNIIEERSRSSRRSYPKLIPEEIDMKNIYVGESDAFSIELFNLRDDFDQRHAFDILEAAFEVVKDRNYCIMTVPCTDKKFPLLQHFAFVPTRNNISSNQALYVAHRSSVLGRLRVRRADFADIPQIAQLLHNLDGKEIIWTVENCIGNRHNPGHQAYVFVCGLTIIGVGILEPPEQIDFIRAKFNLESYHNHKYHFKGQGVFAGFSIIKTIIVYPSYEVHFRFFARELMRLSNTNSLLWLTCYRNKLVTHKTNSLCSAMLPIMPRVSEVDSGEIPELKKIHSMSKHVVAFSTWFLNRRITSVPKFNIDTRILVVGASRTCMGFLNSLIFSDTSTYLTFTNITLVSPQGMPYIRHPKPAVKNMFPKYKSMSDRFLKSVPYTYYVNIVQGTMAEIDKPNKFIRLSNGTKCHYDMLFLFIGKQYQHPYYLRDNVDKDTRDGKKEVGSYKKLDVPRKTLAKITLKSHATPENVFVVNDINYANNALKYVKNKFSDDYECKIVVYGSTIETYCCIGALLQGGIPPANIIFVESFPPEQPTKPRVSIFCNIYVDHTVREVINNLRIKVYSGYYFQSWTIDASGQVSHVDFLSTFKLIHLECDALFFYGKYGIDVNALSAINSCGMTYDGGILIDNEFRTKDPYIYAAGPVTKYRRNFFAEGKQHKYHDSDEIGKKLGLQIRNQLDPLFAKNKPETDDVYLNENSQSPAPPKFPVFKKPLVWHCSLPGRLQYLEVRPPGQKLPHHFMQSLDFNGTIMETYQRGYFKIHMNRDMIVDGITCLTTEDNNLENVKNIFGLSTISLNNVYLRFQAKKIDNFFSFFQEPWAFFLYIDTKDELFAVIKELLPRSHQKHEVMRRMSNFQDVRFHEVVSKKASDELEEPLSLSSFKLMSSTKTRSIMNKMKYVEAITDFLFEWLDENDLIMSVYLHPAKRVDFEYDIKKNPCFKRKRRSVENMLKNSI